MNSDRKYLAFILIFFGLGSILFQSMFVPFITIRQWRPDLVLVIVLLIGKRFGPVTGSSAGFVLGLLQDSLTSMPVGITALPKTIVGFGAGKTKLLGNKGTIHYLWFLILILIHELIAYLFFQFKTDISFSSLIVTRVFPNTVYTTLLLLIVNLFAGKYFSEE